MRKFTRATISVFLAFLMLFSMITAPGVIPTARAETPETQAETQAPEPETEASEVETEPVETEPAETDVPDEEPAETETTEETSAAPEEKGEDTKDNIPPAEEKEDDPDEKNTSDDTGATIAGQSQTGEDPVLPTASGTGTMRALYCFIFGSGSNFTRYYPVAWFQSDGSYFTAGTVHTHELKYTNNGVTKTLAAYCLSMTKNSNEYPYTNSSSWLAGSITDGVSEWSSAYNAISGETSEDIRNAVMLVLAYAQKALEDSGRNRTKSDELAIQIIIWEILYGRRHAKYPYNLTMMDRDGHSTAVYDSPAKKIDATLYPNAEYTGWAYGVFVQNRSRYKSVTQSDSYHDTATSEWSNAGQLYKDIICRLSVHGMLPSFMYETQTDAQNNRYPMTYAGGQYTVTLTDTNGVLPLYYPGKTVGTPWTSSDGLTQYVINKIANSTNYTLTITTTNQSIANGIYSVQANSLDYNGSNGVVVFSPSNTSMQPTVSFDLTSPQVKTAYFGVSITTPGTAKISKTTTDGSSKEGFCFHLECSAANVDIYAKTNSSGNAYQTVMSGSNPYGEPAAKVYTFDGLFDGTYKFTEDLGASGKTDYYPESITFKIGSTVVGTYRYDNGGITSSSNGTKFTVSNLVLSGLSGKQLQIIVSNTKKGKLTGVKTATNNGPVADFGFTIYRPKGSYSNSCTLYTRTDASGNMYITDSNYTEVTNPGDRVYTYPYERLLDGQYIFREYDKDPTRNGQYEIKSATVIVRDVNGNIIHTYGPYTVNDPEPAGGGGRLYKSGSDIYDCVKVDNLTGLTGGGTLELHIENGPVVGTSVQIQKISDGLIEGIPFKVERRASASDSWTLIQNTPQDPDFYTDENGLIHIPDMTPGQQVRITEDFTKPILADYICIGSSVKTITLVQGVNTVAFENRRRATAVIRKTSDDGVVVGVPFNIYCQEYDSDSFQLLPGSPYYTVATSDPTVGEIVLDYSENLLVGDYIKAVEIPLATYYTPEMTPQSGIIQLTADPENNQINAISVHNKVNSELTIVKKCVDGNVEVTFDIYVGRAPNLEYLTTVTTVADPNDATQGYFTLDSTDGIEYGTWLTIQEVMDPEDAGNYVCHPNGGVAEIQLQGGMNTVTFVNTPLANLYIRKTVPNGDPNGFTFNVKKVLNPSASPSNYQYEDKGNFTTRTVTINGEPVDGVIIANWDPEYGEMYRIEEIVTSDTQYYTCISDNPQFITLTTGDNTVSFTNVPNGLTIEKTADDGNVDNIEFYVWQVRNHEPTTPPNDAMVVSTGVGNNGVITISEVVVGQTYRIQEKTQNPDYVCSPEYAEITIQQGTNRVSFHNSVVTHLKIQKTSADGNVSGISFRVAYTRTTTAGRWTTLGTFTTDGDGYIDIPNVTYGYYYQITETLTAAQQALYDPSPQTQIVHIEEPITTVYFENIPKTHLILTKTSTDGNVAGIEFEIELQVEEGGSTTFIPYCTGTTDASGQINFDQYDSMQHLYGETIRITERVPEGYLPQSPQTITLTTGTNTVTFTNQPIIGHFSVEKRTPDEQPVSGVSFRLWNEDESIVRTGTSGSDGVIDFGDLPYGHYYYQETSAPIEYVLPDLDTVWEVNITTTQHVVHVRYNEANNGGSLSVLKTDEDGEPLPGAKFKLEYRLSESDEWQPVQYGAQSPVFAGYTSSSVDSDGCIETGADGIANFQRLGISAGSVTIYYRLREVAAPTGYVLDDSVIFEGQLTPQHHSYSLTAENELIYGSLKIVKIEKNHPETPLYHAGFRIYNSDDELVAEVYTDVNGLILIENLPYGDYYFKEFAAPLGFVLDETPYPFSITTTSVVEMTAENERETGTVKIVKVDGETQTPLQGVVFWLFDSTQTKIAEGTTNANGEVTFGNLVAGTYYYQEQSTVNGYQLDQTMHLFAFSGNGTLTITVDNNPLKGGIRILKQDGETRDPLQGVVFWLYDSTQTKIAEGTTDQNGYVSFGNLRYGNYYYQEHSTIPGYVLDNRMHPFTINRTTVIEVVMNNQPVKGSLKLVKIDGEREIPLEGVVFWLFDAEQHKIADGTTDENGEVEFAGLRRGTYYYQEQSTASGYILDGAMHELTISGTEQLSITVENEPIKGKIRILKVDGETQQPINNVGFRIFDEDDHQVREGYTNAEGIVEFDGLYLGSYTYQEFTDLNGYIADHNKYPFSLTVEETLVTVTMENTPQKGGIKIVKVDKDTQQPLEGVVFYLYDSTQTKINEGTTNAAGEVIFNGLRNGSYYYQEHSTLPGFQLDNTMYPFTVSGTTVLTVTMENEPYKGAVEILKVDGQTQTPLSGVVFYLYDSTQTKIAEGITNAQGKVTFSGLRYGTYYYQEYSDLPGYVADHTLHPLVIDRTATIPLTMENTPILGSIKIVKVDGQTRTPLPNVEFWLYDSNQQKINEGTTNAAGELTFSGLRVGTYYYKEITELPGYHPDHELHSLNINDSDLVTVTMENNPIFGSIKIYKYDGERSYPLEGVVFWLYDSTHTKIAEGTTNAAGEVTFGNLRVGTYYYQEHATISGYVLDDSMHEFTIENEVQKTFDVPNEPVKGSIRILKVDGDTQQPLANVGFRIFDENDQQIRQGSTNSEGVVTFDGLYIGSYTYQEYTEIDGFIADHNKYPFSVTEANKDIEITMENTPIKGALKIVKTDGKTHQPLQGVVFWLYDSTRTKIAEGTTNAQGIVTFENLKYGSYFYQEYSCPDNYVRDPNLYPFSIEQNGVTIEKEVENLPIEATIQIVKLDEDERTPISGVGFRLYDEHDNIIAEDHTNAQGIVEFPEIPMGSYFYQEFDPPAGYIADLDKHPVNVTEITTIEIEVTNKLIQGKLVILKIDGETTLPLQGVVFRILDENEVEVRRDTTGADGTVTFANLPEGDYYYQEVSTLDGYILDTNLHAFSVVNNDPIEVTVQNGKVRGNLKIVKVDKDTQLPLANVGFRLYDANGQQIDEAYTNAQGEVLFENLVKGTYYYQEFSELHGYIADHELHEFNITQNGTIEVKVENEPISGTLQILKKDEDGTTPLEGVGFRIYDNADGTGEPVASDYTDENGVVEFTGLEEGEYWYQEFHALPGYEIDNNLHHFSVEDNDPIVVTVTNEKIRGKLRIVKVDKEDPEHPVPLEGVTFTLYDSSDHEIDTKQTNGEGVVEFEDLLVGTYYFREVATLDDYVLDNEPHELIVSESTTYEVEVTNDKIRADVRIVKVDPEDPEHPVPLEGVGFRIYDNASGEGEPIAEDHTNAEGVVVFNGLLKGTYYYQEFDFPDGYVPDNELHEFSVTTTDTVEITVSNRLISATLRILKVDATDPENKTPMEGVGFSIYDDPEAEEPMREELFTNGEGVVEFTGLRKGTYWYKETTPPAGYLADTEMHEFSVTEETVLEYTVENVLISGKIQILKVDGDDNTIVLEGVGFRIYDNEEGEGEPIAEDFTDENGIVVFENLPEGTYWYQEFQTLDNYVLDPTLHEFTVENNEPIEVEFPNYQGGPGSITVYKYSTNGSLLSGVTFCLEYSLDGTTWQPVVYSADTVAAGNCSSEGLANGKLTTDATGKVTFTGLYVGSEDTPVYYRVTETATRPGYSLLANAVFEGTLHESENHDLVFYAYNDHVFRLPHTGGIGFKIVGLAGLLVALAAALFWMSRKKKEQDDGHNLINP